MSTMTSESEGAFLAQGFNCPWFHRSRNYGWKRFGWMNIIDIIDNILTYMSHRWEFSVLRNV